MVEGGETSAQARLAARRHEKSLVPGSEPPGFASSDRGAVEEVVRNRQRRIRCRRRGRTESISPATTASARNFAIHILRSYRHPIRKAGCRKAGQREKGSIPTWKILAPRTVRDLPVRDGTTPPPLFSSFPVAPKPSRKNTHGPCAWPDDPGTPLPGLSGHAAPPRSGPSRRYTAGRDLASLVWPEGRDQVPHGRTSISSATDEPSAVAPAVRWTHCPHGAAPSSADCSWLPLNCQNHRSCSLSATLRSALTANEVRSECTPYPSKGMTPPPEASPSVGTPRCAPGCQAPLVTHNAIHPVPDDRPDRIPANPLS